MPESTRPKRGHRQRRGEEVSVPLAIRFTPRELDMLQARADGEGRVLSDYIRRQSLQIVGLPMFTTESLVGELYRRGYTLLMAGDAVYDESRKAAEAEMEKARETMEREAFPNRYAEGQEHSQ